MFNKLKALVLLPNERKFSEQVRSHFLFNYISMKMERIKPAAKPNPSPAPFRNNYAEYSCVSIFFAIKLCLLVRNLILRISNRKSS